MKIEMSLAEMFSVFGNLENEGEFRNLINMNGQNFFIKNYYSYSDLYGTRVDIELTQVVKPKSPQELAAEDAVKKAEIALKAAQDVLKQVKEK